MNEAEGKVTDLTNKEDFPWRLRCMMALADIQSGELARESGVPKVIIYKIRADQHKGKEETREKLILAIENWRPGTIAMMRAAENSTKIHK